MITLYKVIHPSKYAYQGTRIMLHDYIATRGGLQYITQWPTTLHRAPPAAQPLMYVVDRPLGQCRRANKLFIHSFQSNPWPAPSEWVWNTCACVGQFENFSRRVQVVCRICVPQCGFIFPSVDITGAQLLWITLLPIENLPEHTLVEVKFFLGMRFASRDWKKFIDLSRFSQRFKNVCR